jgi:hypothetical protein
MSGYVLADACTGAYNVSAEINNRITLANFGMVNMLKAKNINR